MFVCLYCRFAGEYFQEIIWAQQHCNTKHTQELIEYGDVFSLRLFIMAV